MIKEAFRTTKKIEELTEKMTLKKRLRLMFRYIVIGKALKHGYMFISTDDWAETKRSLHKAWAGEISLMNQNQKMQNEIFALRKALKRLESAEEVQA